MRQDPVHQSLGDGEGIPDDAAAVARFQDHALTPIADVDFGGGPGMRWGGGEFGDLKKLGAFGGREEVGDEEGEVIAVFREGRGGEVDTGGGAGWWGGSGKEGGWVGSMV